MSEQPNLFLSYAEADRKIGERLHASLERHGCLVHDPADGAQAPDAGVRIEEAVRGSDHFVLLFGRHRGRDRVQEQEWQAALEETWEHPDKRMIPVLLRDAELPSFVRSAAAATGDTVGLHLQGLRQIEEAAAVIARAARRATVAADPCLGDTGEPKKPKVAGLGPAPRGDTGRRYDQRRNHGRELSFLVKPATAEESSARFSDLERYAEELEL